MHLTSDKISLHTFAGSIKLTTMKKIPVILFSLILSSIVALASGENGAKNDNVKASVSVSGAVEDMLSSEKLVCAKIEIDELDMTIFTDIQGNYSIDNIEPGNYTLKVSYISYEELELKQITIGGQKELNIQLKPLWYTPVKREKGRLTFKSAFLFAL